MMLSMTGFGQALAEKDAESFTVTLKSVNHRFFETSFRIPACLEHLETLMRNVIQKDVKRGRVSVTISHVNESRQHVVLNEDLVLKYFNQLESARKKLGLSKPVEISSFISLPGVFSQKTSELKSKEREALIKTALQDALSRLMQMRFREGEALGKSLASYVKDISRHMDFIEKIIKAMSMKKKKNVSAEALESYLRSTDVSEELTRIRFHLKSFSKHMERSDPKGKVLDFIGQELQREINTLGAKVQNKNAAYRVVMVKNLIEKMREQVQNVE
jgi:uncharacterized protein (TIGR00255 family)